MTFLIVLGIYFGILFAFAFLSRRLVAVASLVLCAGAELARLWTNDLTPLVAQSGVTIISPPLSSIVAVALTLLPAILVVAKSPKGKGAKQLVSSLVFATLGVMLTYGAFSNAVILDSQSKAIVQSILANERWIITIGILVALAEVLLLHRPHHGNEKSK